MSFFKDNESADLNIQRMILHVVSGNEEQDFLRQDEIAVPDAADFFIERVIANSSSSLHKFSENSTTRELLSEMCSADDAFVESAQELSRRFALGHTGQTAAGAFFVILFSCGVPNVQFVCMVKYDYREAVELYEEQGQAALRTIVQAFVADKKAIQKYCLVRVENGVVADEVSATDRSGKAPDLTHYFQSFLDVKRDRDEEELSNNLNEAIRKTLQQCKEILPHQDVVAAVNHVKGALRGQTDVGEDLVRNAMRAAVGRPDDESANSQIDKTLKRNFKAQRLEGIEFQPEQRIFRTSPRRRIKTQEGVEITFRARLQGEFVIERDLEGGGREIVITTQNDEYTEDTTIRDKHR